MNFSIYQPVCHLVPVWGLDVGFLVWRFLVKLCVGGWCWKYSGGQGDLRAGGSGNALPMQNAHNTYASMLYLFSFCPFCLPLGCLLLRSQLEFVDYFLWIAVRKTGVEWKVNSINPSSVISSGKEEAVFWDNSNIWIHHNGYIQIAIYLPNTVINLLHSHLVVVYQSNVSQKLPLVTVRSIILGALCKIMWLVVITFCYLA